MQQFRSLVPCATGAGALDALEGKIKALGLKKILLVHGRTRTEAADRIKAIAARAGAEIVTFSNICSDPTDVSCMEGAAVLKAAGNVDGIIGLGGGSALDTAKCINVLATNPEPLFQYTTPGGGHPTKPGLPLILIPTTAGTGAECTFVAVVTWTEQENRKISVISPNCCTACLAIADPELTTSMPASVTVASGVDALAHACEALTVVRPNPISDALAKEAIGVITKWLPKAVADGSDLEAREAMSTAALLSGQAFSNTLVHHGHAFGHGLGAYFHKPHGFMVGAALPTVLQYVAVACPQRVKVIAQCMGASFRGDETPAEIGTVAAERLYRFYREIGMPGLTELGIEREALEGAVPFIAQDPCFRLSSRPMAESDILTQAQRMYDRSL